MSAPTPNPTNDHIHAFLQQQITILAWLHAELVYQLQQLLSSQQALVNRAKAVRLAQQNRNKAAARGQLRPQ